MNYLKTLFAIALLGSYIPAAIAQQLIERPADFQLARQVASWNSGGAAAVDEEFYISREGLKPLLPLQGAPWGNPFVWTTPGNGSFLPSGVFDSDIFSAWSSIDRFADFALPAGWVTGAMADVAHRNGVGVSGTAVVKPGRISETATPEIYRALTELAATRPADLARFLNAHGVAGLTFTSNWQTTPELQAALQTLLAEAGGHNVLMANVGNDGTYKLAPGLTTDNSANFTTADGRPVASLLLADGWEESSAISGSRSVAEAAGRSMTDLYAPFRSHEQASALAGAGYSAAIYDDGANRLWDARSTSLTADGRQEQYQALLQEFYLPTASLEGEARLMATRSTLGWNLADEPFVTRFNLGNGRFFNIDGERRSDNDWYNIGIQDYLPSWRFWWAGSLLGRQLDKAPLSARFTWRDAWTGGSSLEIAGTSGPADNILHLFRTDFKVSGSDCLTLRYKLTSGTADVSLILAAGCREVALPLLCRRDNPAAGEWVEKRFGAADFNGLFDHDGNLSVIALKVSDARNLNLLLGELTLGRESYSAPAAPSLESVDIASFIGNRLDVKLRYAMPADAEPESGVTLNNEVNVSAFRLWAQPRGGEATLAGMTTSWGAVINGYCVDSATPSVRFGVQAIGRDGCSESAIAWSDFLTPAVERRADHTVVATARCIAAGLGATLSFADPLHEDACWRLTDNEGREVASANGVSLTVEPGLIETPGVYDLELTMPGGEVVACRSALTVLPRERGAAPVIESLSVDGTEIDPLAGELDVDNGYALKLGYTATSANGKMSRGLHLNGRPAGVPVADLGLDGKSFAMGAWIKPRWGGSGAALMSVDDRRANWPYNFRGYAWVDLDSDGNLTAGRRTDSGTAVWTFERPSIEPDLWSHVAASFETSADGRKVRVVLLVNGRELTPLTAGYTASAAETPATAGGWIEGRALLDNNMWLSFGGNRSNETGILEGVVDDIAVWKRAITPADARDAMAGFHGVESVAATAAFWSFEADADASGRFADARRGAPLCSYDVVTTDQEVNPRYVARTPVYATGSPLTRGDRHEVVTRAGWSVPYAQLLNVSDADSRGEATVGLGGAGSYVATVTLTNEFGSDTATFPVLNAATTGLEPVEGSDALIDLSVNGLIITAACRHAASASMTIVTPDGRLVATARSSAAAVAECAVPSPGLYIATVSTGAGIRNFKIMVK